MDFRVESAEPDRSLGVDSVSITWRRMTLHGQVSRAFGDGALHARDTLGVAVWYSRMEQQFHELHQEFGPRVWSITPTRMFPAVLLLQRRPGGWEAVRSLYPNHEFVEMYVRAAELPSREFVRVLMKALLDRYFGVVASTYGEMMVVEDDLDRVLARDPGTSSIWREEIRARPGNYALHTPFPDMSLFVRLARYLPPARQRDCLRQLLRFHDDAVGELEKLQAADPDTMPAIRGREVEMDEAMYRQMCATATISIVPGAMRALLPARGRNQTESNKSIVAQARRYAAP